MKKRPPKAWQLLAWMALGAFLLEESEPSPPALSLAKPRQASLTTGHHRAPPGTTGNQRQPAITVYDKSISWGGDYSGEWT